jgi:hypothetical protein
MSKFPNLCVCVVLAERCSGFKIYLKFLLCVVYWIFSYLLLLFKCFPSYSSEGQGFRLCSYSKGHTRVEFIGISHPFSFVIY